MAHNVDINNISKAEYTNAYKRLNPFPLDPDSLYDSLEAAEEYAKNGATAHVGQLIAVVDTENGKATAYIILNEAGDLKKVGSAEAILNANAAPTNNDSDYDVGQTWVKQDTKEIYFLVDNTPNAAVWKKLVRQEDVSTAIANDVYRHSHNSVTSLSDVPTDKLLVIAEITETTQSFTLADNTLKAGKELHVIVHNAGAEVLAVTIPDSSPYVKCSSDSVVYVAADAYVEINVLSTGDNLYLRTI